MAALHVRRMKALLAVMICLFLVPSNRIDAQVVGATVSGSVSDPSGKAIVGANITLLNTAQGTIRTAKTNSDGLYVLPNIDPGSYRMEVSAPGFGLEVRRGITLSIGDHSVVDIKLAINSVVTVEVPAGGLLESAVAQPGGLVNGTIARELPLNGRDYTQLASLRSGVNLIRSQPDANSVSSRGNRGFGTQFTIAGGRPQQNSYRLDGIITNDYANAGPGSTAGISPGVDGLQEFSIVTSNYSASYGLTSGGVINALTRAGTNRFHGSAYEFIRNDILDARSYFSVPGTEYPFRQNQFGVTFGGPFVHNHSFIFGNYEGLRKILTQPTISVVPSLEARSGTINGVTYTVDPQAARYLTFYPLPVPSTVNPVTGAGTYSFPAKEVSPDDFFTTRFDQMFSQHTSIYLTYLFDHGSTSLPDPLNTTEGFNSERRQTVSLVYSHLVSNNFYNSIRVGGNRERVQTLITLPGANPASSDPSYGAAPGLYAPSIQVSGFTTFNGGLNSSGATNYGFTTPQFYYDASLARGHHSVKIGFAFERFLNNQLTEVTPDGLFKFNSLALYLQNQPASLQVQVTPSIPRDIRQSVIGAYIEDEWRLAHELTLLLGARYETSTVPTETANRLSNLESLTASAPVVGGPLFQNPTHKNLEPRLGFSYSPDLSGGKMIVSGGYGIFDVLPLTYQFNLMVTQNAPFMINRSSTSLPAGSFPSTAYALVSTSGTGKARETYIQFHPPRNYVQQYNLTIQEILPWNLRLKAAWVGSHGVHQAFRTTDANIPQPTKAPNGQLIVPCAAFVAGLTNLSCKTPAPPINPAFGQIDGQAWISGSSYNGLLFEVSQSRGSLFQWSGNFTWQKSLDGNSSVIAGGPFQNSISGQFLFHPLRAVSDFDVPKSVVISGVWTAPHAVKDTSALGIVANGWEWTGIFQAASGQPFTPVFSGDINGDGNTVPFDVPDRIAAQGCRGNPVNVHNFHNYIKQSCFAVPQNTSGIPGTAFGNAGRNSIFGPGYMSLDFSMLKSFAIKALGEEAHLQLRLEFFDITNRPNINAPYTNNKFAIPSTITQVNGYIPVDPSGNTGLATTSSAPRQIQLGAKLVF